jgi:hypothetical protein
MSCGFPTISFEFPSIGIDIPDLPALPELPDFSLYLDLDLPLPAIPGLAFPIPEIDLPELPALPDLLQIPCPFEEDA